MKRVLVDDRCLRGQLTGVGVYLSEVLRHWPVDSGIRLHGAFGLLHRRRPVDPEASGVVRLRPLSEALSGAQPGTGPGAGSRRLMETGLRSVTALRWAAGGFDAFFAPNHVPPITPGKLVLTVHDLSVLSMPECHPPHRVAWMRAAIDRRVFQRADRVVCVSEATARDVEHRLSVDPAVIRVAPLGPRFEPPTGEEARLQINAPRAIGRFVVHLGTIEPRKNHAALLDAYRLLSADERRETALIFVGRAGWGDEAFWERLRSHPMAGEALWADYLPDETAAALLAQSAALLAPSKLEGFGLPVLEAMRLGVPAVVSPDPALTEVAGPGARVIDPEDIEGWAQAMRCPPEISPEAAAHSAKFTWDRCAHAHEQLLSELIG